MTGRIKLDVAVPERLLISEQVDEVQIPALGGSMGVLPGHASLISQLGTGVLTYRVDQQIRYMALSGGVTEVLPDHVRVLADSAEWAEEINVKRAEESRRRANDLLRRHDMEIDVERASRAIARAQARLEAGRRANLG
jgi:F-type H+-transporting ATPase subunit epsilon